MVTALHQELKNLSGNNPAGYISKNLFSHFTLERLKDIAKRMQGIALLAGNGQLSAALREIQWASVDPSITLVPPRDPKFPGMQVDLQVSTGFNVIFYIFITGFPGEKISEIVLEFTDVRAKLRAENNSLIFEGSDFEVKRNISRLAVAEQLLLSHNIDPGEAFYVEGHLGYGVISQAVAVSISRRQDYPLANIFPYLDFGTAIQLAILSNGEFLGIIPTAAVTLNPNARCLCAEGHTLDSSDTDLSTIDQQPDPEPGTKFGLVKIGGPVAENKDPLKDLGNRFRGTGEIGTYIPLAFTKSMVGEPMPGIIIPAVDDSGVIGYNARATVAFKDPKISFDIPNGGILLDFILDIHTTAYCDFEVFKGVRLPIGWAAILPKTQGQIQVGLYPVADKNGTLKLQSVLLKSDMGEYQAVVIGVGTMLSVIGIASWIGFLVDVVLARILAHALPLKLEEELGKYMANREWKLIDGLPVIDPAKRIFPGAPFDLDADSLLASMNFKG